MEIGRCGIRVAVGFPLLSSFLEGESPPIRFLKCGSTASRLSISGPVIGYPKPETTLANLEPGVLLRSNMASQSENSLESWALDIIEDRSKGTGADLLRGLLRGLSVVFTGLVQLRLWLYRIGVKRYHTLGCQVISVGNLTVGGTGKTPVVEVLARLLEANGRRVAILSRGYKREKKPFLERWKDRLLLRSGEEPPPQVVTDGETVFMDSAHSGDEPYMLARNLRGVAVIVGSDRVRSGKYAIKKLGCDTLILDDGFQHLRLKHRLDIVLVDATNPFGNGRCLPRGILREPVRNIKRAGFIFITKSRPTGEPELRQTLRALNPTAEISECRHSAKYFQDVYTDEKQPLTMAEGKRVVAISGIARPRGFENELVRQGAEVLDHRMFPDHHRFTSGEIMEVANRAVEMDADCLVTTEKDAVRFPHVKGCSIPMVYLRVEIEMMSGSEQFNEWIARICFEG